MTSTTQNDVSASAFEDAPTGRRKSAFARRKSSAVVDETPAAIVEASALSDADRRLAEMGYIQVSMRQTFHGVLLTFL